MIKQEEEAAESAILKAIRTGELDALWKVVAGDRAISHYERSSLLLLSAIAMTLQKIEGKLSK
ncbi:MAG: hypothetical protein WCC94_05480 [Candidatus Bathyarchaeia archaeon]